MSGGDFPREIESLFSKRYAYAKDQSWRLPEVWDVLAGEHEEFGRLMDLKESLNEVKNRLSDKKLDDWHRHTAYTNKAGRVVPEVRRQANAELCTQAWCKFHEIVCTYPLIPGSALWSYELNTIHLCEAPGAFIASLNHYLQTREVRCDWNWVANTLNPYHEANNCLVMIADDRLIANTLPWWYFGPDDTGDIMTLKYLNGLQQLISSMSSVHLITADGSFDCQGNPGEQESLVYPLHYCEVVTCLTLLSPGGSFVLKMFTLLQQSSVNLLYLLNCSFQEVHVIKPGTSKAGNSEVYVVCLHYVGKEALRDHLIKMTAHFGAEAGGKSLFPQSSLPPSFLESHFNCCRLFYEHQRQTILENLRLFSGMRDEDRAHLDHLRQAAVLYYVQSFQIRGVPRKRWLVKKPQVGCSLNARWLGTRHRRTDTYNERKRLEALTWPEKIACGYFSAFLNKHVEGNLGQGCFLELSDSRLKCEDWYPLQGQQLARIQSSPFCDGELLNMFNETIDGCGDGRIHSLTLPSCPFCPPQPAESIISDLLGRVDDGGHVLVVGATPLFEALQQWNLSLAFLESPAPLRPLSVLHDGDPQYQQRLLDSLLLALPALPSGGTLLLPVMSSLSRFTAAIVYILYYSFQRLGFSCPTSHLTPGVGATLLCWGYQPLPDAAIQQLQQLKRLVDGLATPGETRQVLQFIPIEELLKSPFVEFLWDLNSAIIGHSLHLIGLQEHQLASPTPNRTDTPQPQEQGGGLGTSDRAA